MEPLGEKTFDGELAPFEGVVESLVDEKYLQRVKENQPEHWNRVWAKVESVLADHLSRGCALLDEITIKVYVTESWDGHLDLQAQVRWRPIISPPAQWPGATSGDKWMTN